MVWLTKGNLKTKVVVDNKPPITGAVVAIISLNTYSAMEIRQ